jgi:tetratricopeptide (TPR) repeat protein
MQFVFRSQALRVCTAVAFSAALLALVGVLGFAAFREGFSNWAVNWAVNRHSPEMLKKALALDPSNPALYVKMGQFQLLSPVDYDAPAGVRSLEHAAALDPNNPFVWTELVLAYEAAGDVAGSQRAADKAVELDPRTPRVQWLAANAALLANQPDSAMERLRTVLALDVSYAPAVFSAATRWTGDPAIVETRLMPSENQPELRLDLLGYLVGIDRLDLAPRTWQAVVAAKRPFPFPLVQPYLDRLIASATAPPIVSRAASAKPAASDPIASKNDAQQAVHAAQALSVWRDLQTLGVVPGPNSSGASVESKALALDGAGESKVLAPDSAGAGQSKPLELDGAGESKALAPNGAGASTGAGANSGPDSASKSDKDAGNLIFNGGFEHTPLGGGFDWRILPQPGVWMDFPRVEGIADSGPDSNRESGTASGHCVRVDFIGEGNQDYEVMAEIVPVRPGTRYVLKARARSADITSDSGPVLRVADPACPTCAPVESAGTTGTTPWHPLELAVATGPRQRFLRVSLWRARGRTFPTRITGSFWLDSVSLHPAGS